MNIELVNEIKSLVEEYISEVSDETIKKARAKRVSNVEKTRDKFFKVSNNGTPEEIEKAEKEWHEAGSKLMNIDKLRNLRNFRKDEERTALARFKEKLLNRKPQTVRETRKAKEEHDNALINQGLRNKLEKSLKVSESCLNDIMLLIEGEIIDFQKKRKEKVLDRNAYKMADILSSGKLKVTKTGQLMGDPEAMKQIKDIEKENKEVGLGRKVGLN
jgi:hypothetical protein